MVGTSTGRSTFGSRLEHPSPERLSTDARLALRAARLACEKIKDQYTRKDGVKIHTKDDNTPVTSADLAADQAIRSYLEMHSDAPILSEEHQPEGMVVDTKAPFWLVDPLDGTKEFVAGTGEFVVCIALILDEQPQIGVIGVPMQQTFYVAERDSYALRIDSDETAHPIATRPHAENLRMLVSRRHNTARIEDIRKQWPELETSALGSALKFCRLAEGAADVYMRRSSCYIWDTAAGECLVEAAGGRMRTMNGDRLVYRWGCSTNPSFVACGDPQLAFPDRSTVSSYT